MALQTSVNSIVVYILGVLLFQTFALYVVRERVEPAQLWTSVEKSDGSELS